jgi:hypothetical protein
MAGMFIFGGGLTNDICLLFLRNKLLDLLDDGVTLETGPCIPKSSEDCV